MGKFKIDEEEFFITNTTSDEIKEETEKEEKKVNDSLGKTEKSKKTSQQIQSRSKKEVLDLVKIFSNEDNEEKEKDFTITVKINSMQKEILKLTADALEIKDGKSGIVREALKLYFQKIDKDKYVKNYIETVLKFKKIL